jgi:hypothetical protein
MYAPTGSLPCAAVPPGPEAGLRLRRYLWLVALIQALALGLLLPLAERRATRPAAEVALLER